MARIGHTTFKSIRSARLSLENAEQSFLENQEMRGELDLMLAEAELKNLRRKNSFPWSWNRQLLALCIAVLVAVAGLGGWYYAHLREEASIDNSQAVIPVESADTVKVQGGTNEAAIVVLPQAGEININKTPLPVAEEKNNQTYSDNVDIRQLVHSARVELSSSN